MNVFVISHNMWVHDSPVTYVVHGTQQLGVYQHPPDIDMYTNEFIMRFIGIDKMLIVCREMLY